MINKMASMAKRSMAYFKAVPFREDVDDVDVMSNVVDTSAPPSLTLILVGDFSFARCSCKKLYIMSSPTALENSSKDLVELTPVFRGGENEQRKVARVCN